MLPDIKSGDVLIVDRSVNPFNRSVVAVFFNGTPLCKQLIIEGNSKCLHSLNKKYKDIEITENDELAVFGVVIGLARDFYC